MCGIVKLHPARGRKPVDIKEHFHLFPDCNLSPQGDENFRLIVVDQSAVNDCNLSPQGDGNFSRYAFTFSSNDCNLPPQGDGNPPRIGFWLRLIELQFIPARGQKSTSATGICQQRRCFAFSYILFYRLGTAPAGIVFVTGSALTPCGTSGFMGRISCR